MPSQRVHRGRGGLNRAKGDSGELVSVRVTVAVLMIGQYRSAKIRRHDAAGKKRKGKQEETGSKAVRVRYGSIAHALLHSPSACVALLIYINQVQGPG